MPPEIQGRFRGRKDGTAQNVLAAIGFNLKFTYVLAGWEGSAHDSCALNDVFARPGGFSIPEGIINSRRYYRITSLFGFISLINFVRFPKHSSDLVLFLN